MYSLSTSAKNESEILRQRMRQFTLSQQNSPINKIVDDFRREVTRHTNSLANISTAVAIVGSEISRVVNPTALGAVSHSQSGYVLRLSNWNATDKRAAAAELLAYLDLEDGWDGVGSLKPSKSAISSAYDFLNRLTLNSPTPDPTVYSDGQVGWYWKNGNSIVSVVFGEDGKYAYYGKVGYRTARSSSKQYGSAIPQELVNLIELLA